MTRLIRIEGKDAQLLTRAKSRGVVTFFKFLKGDSDDTHKWQTPDVADMLKSLPSPDMPRTMEIWVRRESIQIGFWTPSKISADQLENQVKTFNPAAVEYSPATPFPSIKPGTLARVGRVVMRRCAVSPIESSFGMKAEEGRNSPVVLFLNNLPVPPDGSTIVIQIVWRRHWYNWKVNPFTRWEFPARPVDTESCAEKAKTKHTYYVDIRLAELHASKEAAKTNFCAIAGQAFSTWNKDRGNGFVYRDLAFWSKPRITDFLGAMVDRDWKRFRVSIFNTRRAHLSKDELSSIIHLPPQGSQVPRLIYTDQKVLKATPSQRASAEAIRASLQSKGRHADPHRSLPGSIEGRPRKMTASEVSDILKRAGVN